MKITISESELYHSKEIYFTPTDLNGVRHEFWMCVQKRKDVTESEVYWMHTYKSSEQVCNAIEKGDKLQKFFPKNQIEYILNSIKEGLRFVKEK